MNTTAAKPTATEPATEPAKKPARIGRIRPEPAPIPASAEAPAKPAKPAKPSKLTKPARKPVLVLPAERPPCLCGCGLVPAGRKARFRPGHDARWYSAQKAAAAAGVAVLHGAAVAQAKAAKARAN